MKLKEIKPGMVIHCKTKEQAKVLANELDNLGYVWITREKLTERCSMWDKYTDICLVLRIDKTVTWSEYKDTKDDDKVEITEFSSLIIEEKTYEDGLNEAWAVLSHVQSGELTPSEIEELWGMSSFDFSNHFTEKYTPQEAIAKLEAYEAEKRIKVGDVVVGNILKGVVTGICNGRAFIMYDDGSSKEIPLGKCQKTGKHIDISSILVEIGKE